MLGLVRQKYRSLLSDKRFSEILTGSAWALSARVVSAGLGMITSIIIARAYGAEVLGVVAVMNSFLILISIFTVLGTKTSILRLIPEHLAKYSPASAFSVYRKTQFFVAGTSLVAGMLLYWGSDFIAETVFSKPHLQLYFALGAIFVFFKSIMLLNTQAVRGIRMIRAFAFMQLLPSLSKLVILVPITIFFFHRDNPIYAMFASLAIAAVAGAWIMDRAFKKMSSSKDILRPTPLREILSISLPMLMTAAMTFLIGQTGVIMLGIFRPEAEVGYYSVAVTLATMAAFVLRAVNSIAAPKFSELFYKGNMDELFYVARKSAKLIFWTTVPIFLFLLLFGKTVLALLYGPDFSVAYFSMIFLIFGQFVNSISGSTGIFMNMTGNQKIFRNIMIVTAFLNVFLNLWLIPGFGIHGAAVAGMVSMVFWNVATLIYIKLKYGRMIGYLPLLTRDR